MANGKIKAIGNEYLINFTSLGCSRLISAGPSASRPVELFLCINHKGKGKSKGEDETGNL